MKDLNPCLSVLRHVENAINVSKLSGTVSIYDDFCPDVDADYGEPVVSSVAISYELWKNGGRI